MGNKNGGFYYGRTSDVSIYRSSSLDQGCCRVPFIGINWSEFMLGGFIADLYGI